MEGKLVEVPSVVGSASGNADNCGVRVTYNQVTANWLPRNPQQGIQKSAHME